MKTTLIAHEFQRCVWHHLNHLYGSIPNPGEWVVDGLEDIAIRFSGADVRRLVVKASEGAGFNKSATDDIQLAVGEAFANALRHGSPDPGKHRISIRCLSAKGFIVAEIADQGPGFDPDSVPEPRNTAASKTEELREGGMGIFIMCSTMDEIRYFPNYPGMLVRMIKRMES